MMERHYATASTRNRLAGARSAAERAAADIERHSLAAELGQQGRMSAASLCRPKNCGRPNGSLNSKIVVVSLNASLNCRIAAEVRL